MVWAEVRSTVRVSPNRKEVAPSAYSKVYITSNVVAFMAKIRAEKVQYLIAVALVVNDITDVESSPK